MNRGITNMIRLLMDECIPPFIRDSRWFMYPFFWYWFKGKNIALCMDFKKKAWHMSDEAFNTFYAALDCRATNRPTDLNNKCISLMLDKADRESSSLLDVGCGRGYWLQLLHEKKKYQLTGCDVFESSPVKNIVYKQGIIESLPFPDKSFDIVTCHHTLEHIRNIKQAVAELKRVARRQLMVIVPKQRYYYYTLDLHLHFFPEQEYLAELMGLDNYTCANCSGDWCYIAEL